MKALGFSSMLLAAAAAAAGCSRPPRSAAPPLAPAPAASLYHRLGGYDALAAVVDDFLRRMLGDAELAAFFAELQEGEKQRLRQMLLDQLCELTGGPCVYVGKDMRTAHGGLGIREADWTRAVGHLEATLEAARVPPAERREVLAAVAGLKDQIVER